MTNYISESKVERMRKGAEFFIQRWEDIFLQGLENLISDKTNIDSLAEQQVDWGNSGLARQMRLLKGELNTDLRCKWIDRISRCIIIARSLINLKKFSELQQLDILVQAGLNQKKSWIASNPIERDRFYILSTNTKRVENLFQRITYFQRERDGQFAQELEYWHIQEKAPIERGHVGQTTELGYRFYPSALPLRIQVVEVFNRLQKSSMPTGYSEVKKWQKDQKANLVKNPWSSVQPAVLNKVTLSKKKGQSVLTDANKKKHLYFDDLKQAICCSAFANGGAFSLFGIGHAGHFEVRSIFCQGVAMSADIELQSIKT
ncbi:MAG: hypothetical protein GVX78_02895 [Bacteroidetes bacterium]|nr:hypothetical protein [Bacteroidota bacterium]